MPNDISRPSSIQKSLLALANALQDKTFNQHVKKYLKGELGSKDLTNIVIANAMSHWSGNLKSLYSINH